MQRLGSLDEGWRLRVEAEAARGRVLRYVVVATARGVSAGLKAVPSASRFGSLAGTRNLLSFTTRRYRTEPLVVSGPGAGAEVTAAGILNDIQSLAGD
jgi:homoserine dehydrogenase